MTRRDLVLANFHLRGEDVVRTSTGRVVRFTPDAMVHDLVRLGGRADGSMRYHRIKHCLLTGVLPDLVDHRDTTRLNNEGVNLRAATAAQNQHNRGVSRRNHLGLKGVSAQKGRFFARIMVHGKLRRLGTFDTAEEAAAAYDTAARELHGEFYRPPT